MIARTHVNVEGEYSIDVFNISGQKTYSTGPHKNFITSSGIAVLPTLFSFADCFRYLSVGAGNTKNSIIAGKDTTALDIPIDEFSYIGGRSVFSDADNSSSQYMSAKFTETADGVALSRSWRIPPGTDLYPMDTPSPREFMLSPGRPATKGISSEQFYTSYPTTFHQNGNPDAIDSVSITDTSTNGGVGWTTNELVGKYIRITDQSNNTQDKIITSNTQWYISISPSNFSIVPGEEYYYEIYNAYNVCNCNELANDIVLGQVTGPDATSAAIYYAGLARPISICDYTGAFMRVVKDVPVSFLEYLVFNYTLYLTANTGMNSFRASTNNGRFPTKVNLNWNPLYHDVSGCHNLIHHGFKMIVPKGGATTHAPWGGEMTQSTDLSYNFTYEFGESFIGSWGSPLEPSTQDSYLEAHISTDNLQFYANAKDGGAYSIGIPAFNDQSGLMLWRSTPYVDTAEEFNSRHVNIRQPGENQRYWPLPTDYTQETSLPNDDFKYNPVAMRSSYGTSTIVGKYTPGTRNRSLTRSYQFVGNTVAATDIVNLPIRSIVLSYVEPTSHSDYLIPYLDCLLTDDGHKNGGTKVHPNLIPQVNKAKSTYSTGEYGYWYVLENDARLTFSFIETWSSPCSPGVVDGC